MSKRESNDMQQELSKGVVPNTNLPEVRRVWYQNEWYYSVIDFIGIWTESPKPNDYWRTMKQRADSGL